MSDLLKIETTMQLLSERLGVEEVNIVQYLKIRLLQLLDIYLHKAREKGKDKKLLKESIRIENIIDAVKRKLENQPTRASSGFYTISNYEDANQLKQYMITTAKKINDGKIDVTAYETILNEFLCGLESIDKSQWAGIMKDSYFGSTILRLFLYSPPKLSADVLNETLFHLSEAIGNFEKLNIQNVHSSEKENLKNEVDNFITFLRLLQNSTSKKLDELKMKISSVDPNVQLDEISCDLDKCITDIENVRLPVDNRFIKLLADTISKIKKRLQSIGAEDSVIQKKKMDMSTQVDDADEQLELVKNFKEVLNIKEAEILEIVSQHADFRQKKIKLEQLKENVQKINQSNKAIVTRKNEIINKISGFIIAEAAVYLRQKIRVIEDYRSYAQQFAFRTDTAKYTTKTEEIKGMNSCLEYISEDNTFFVERKTVIQKRIDEVLDILTKKAEENKRSISEFEKLKEIQRTINNKPIIQGETTLLVFNDYRDNIETVRSFHFRIVAKKMEVLRSLHSHEKKFYEEYVEKLLPSVNILLEKYEKLTEQLCDLNPDQNFQEERQLIETQWNEVQRVISETSRENSETLTIVFDKFKQQISEILIKIEGLNGDIKKVKSSKSKLNDLSQENLTDSAKTEALGEFEEAVLSFEEKYTSGGLLKFLPDVKKEILIEKSKETLNYIISNRIKSLKEGLTLENIAELFIVKENIEDIPIPGEIQELNALKELALDEVKNMMGCLDKQLSVFAFKKIPYENVLNVDSYFTNFKFDNTQNKESVEYVQQIHSHAKTFENDIKCYLGTRDSVDYYIIHENLMRLLEELDQLECEDDELLKEMITTMEYIQKLKRDLLANASSSD